MKKTIMMILIMGVSLFAKPQLGIIGVSDGGAGLGVFDNAYSAAVLFSAVNNKNGVSGSDQMNIEFNAKFKYELDELTKLIIGGKYILITTESSDDDDSDESTKTVLSFGIERTLSEKLALFGETDLYSFLDSDDGANESAALNSARIGLIFKI
jgi:hypothetical protein